MLRFPSFVKARLSTASAAMRNSARRQRPAVEPLEGRAMLSTAPAAVTSLTLVNAATDRDIGGLKDGATVNLGTTGTQLSVRANTSPATVGSVMFQLDGKLFQTENYAIYAIRGNTGTDYNPWTPAAGSHTLVVTPYIGANGTGTAGAGVTVHFTIVSPTPTPTPAPSPSPAWRTVAPIPVPRVEGSHVVANGKLYVFGGFNVGLDVTAETDAYDPATNKWTRLADMPIKETDGSAAYDPKTNTVYVAGMQVGDDDGPPTADVYEYHVGTNTWTKGPPLPSARAAGGLVLVGRQLHFFGGINGARNADVPDHVVLNVDGGTKWTPAAALPDPRNHLAGVALTGKIYAIGGHHARAEQTTSQSEVDVYDPATDKWTKLASLPLARGHINPSTFAAGGRIYVVGGQANGERFLSNVTVYDPAANKWTDLAPLPGPLTAPMADAVNGTLIVTGGHPTLNGPVSKQTLVRPLAAS